MKYLPLIALLLLAGCGGGAEVANNEAAPADAPEVTATVRTATAESGATSDTLTIYGATEAGPGGGHSLMVPAEAIVVSVVAPTGTAVGRGQTVMVLRASPATRLNIAKAATDAAAANAAYQRALRLRADGLMSNADVETARAAAASANATRANVGMGNGLALRAPASGTVQNLTAKPGDQIAAGTTVAAIATPGDLRARFGIDPALAQRVHVGQPLKIDTINGTAPATVTVVGVDPQVDPTTRLASIYVRIPAGLNLSVGEPLKAELSVGASSAGITIPYSALLDDGGRSYVFVVKDGVAKAQDVSPGNSMGDRIQILKGLQPGDKVVTEGGTALEDDMHVTEQGAGAKK